VCYRLWQRADRLASLVSGMFCTPACFRSFTSYPTPGKHCSVPAAKSYSTHAHMYESGSIQRIITLLLPSQPQTSTPGIASGGVHLWLKTAFYLPVSRHRTLWLQNLLLRCPYCAIASWALPALIGEDANRAPHQGTAEPLKHGCRLNSHWPFSETEGIPEEKEVGNCTLLWHRKTWYSQHP